MIDLLHNCTFRKTSVKGGFLHVSQQAGGQSAALGLATASPSPTLDNDMLAMYNGGVGDILQAT